MEITLDKLAKYVADKALNDIKLDGKTIREWVEIIAKQQICGYMGEVSDGYHTFNQLYYQRAVLFACIVKQNKNKAWKSFKHSDGKYCFDSNGEWFIVGIDTPQGSYTYHYAKEYWDMFDCQELDCGKEWDGHTEENVTRLLSLEQQPFINKPCISEGVCREDKMQTLDKIRTEIEQIYQEIDTCSHNEYENVVEQGKEIAYENVIQIIDKYRTEVARMAKRKIPKVNMYDAELKLEKFVEQAMKDKSIRKPISWALYQAWKWADANEDEIRVDKGVLEKINEKQDSLKATCKAWDEAISRDGYVN